MTRPALALIVAAAVGMAACGDVTQNDPLPWLRVKKTDGKYEYLVKRLGFFWVRLDEDATGTVFALDDRTAAISTARGLKILARGHDQGVLACGSPRSTPLVVAEAGVVDCFDVIAGPATSVATQIRWRRISGRGEALVVEKLTVENPGRVFARATATFYDAGQQPYFVTMNADASTPGDCALLWIAGGEARSLPAPAEVSRAQCSEVTAWSPLLKRGLRKA
jgi:hypothetical protein